MIINNNLDEEINIVLPGRSVNELEKILCDTEDWIDMISSLCSGGRYNYDKNGELSKMFYKATQQELIKHFK